VLHFDHRLRGEESAGDARFVAEVASALGLAFRSGSWERGEESAEGEERAREARFAFLKRELGWNGERLLCLGHQQDDIVESQLMRLSRGSGTAGLAAPRPVHIFSDGRIHLRPLLKLTGANLRSGLNALGIPSRWDASNERMSFYRNRIRAEVLPLWQKHSPFDIVSGVAAARELLQEDDEALEVWLREFIPAPMGGRSLDLQPLIGKPQALTRRALREWIGAEGLSENLSKAAVDRLLAAAVSQRACRMSAGRKVLIELTEDGRLHCQVGIDRPRPLFQGQWPLPIGGVIFLPGGKELAARTFDLDPALREAIMKGRIESGTTGFLRGNGEPLWVRHRKKGDRFRPLGSPGSRKLQDIFIDMKIPELERPLIPVVLRDAEIAWTPHSPPAEACKIDATTKTVVRLTYTWGKAL
jgi:tRNA(Ile)-lysidine synthase